MKYEIHLIVFNEIGGASKEFCNFTTSDMPYHKGDRINIEKKDGKMAGGTIDDVYFHNFEESILNNARMIRVDVYIIGTM